MRWWTVLTTVLAGESCATAQQPTIDPVRWLTGCWRAQIGNSIVEEQWMAPRREMILGMSRTIRGDSVTNFELVRIYPAGGVVVYAANPSGQRPAEFRTAAGAVIGDDVTFENPAHDFPQRIINRRITPDSIMARIEGITNGQLRGVSFGYRRIACERWNAAATFRRGSSKPARSQQHLTL